MNPVSWIVLIVSVSYFPQYQKAMPKFIVVTKQPLTHEDCMYKLAEMNREVDMRTIKAPPGGKILYNWSACLDTNQTPVGDL